MTSDELKTLRELQSKCKKNNEKLESLSKQANDLFEIIKKDRIAINNIMDPRLVYYVQGKQVQILRVLSESVVVKYISKDDIPGAGGGISFLVRQEDLDTSNLYPDDITREEKEGIG